MAFLNEPPLNTRLQFQAQKSWGFLSENNAKDELINIGKTILKTTQGNPVPAYDMERTVCDIIRSRNRIADETVLSSLKRYAASPKKNLTRLNTYAEAFGMMEAVRRYLEVLL